MKNEKEIHCKIRDPHGLLRYADIVEVEIINLGNFIEYVIHGTKSVYRDSNGIFVLNDDAYRKYIKSAFSIPIDKSFDMSLCDKYNFSRDTIYHIESIIKGVSGYDDKS